MKTAEEILKSKLYPKIIILNNPDYTFNKIIEAMEEYRSQCDELPSDEEIEAYYPVSNSSVYGAIWMRSIASPIISNLKSENERLRFIIENGLGERDLTNDI